ncbi:MAG: ADP-ribose diphosphatase [Alteromonadaceae bacterium]|jgi:ADP-ribose diphosphatase
MRENKLSNQRFKPKTQQPADTLPEILNCEVVAKSRLFTIEALQLKFSNGVERDYERMKGTGRGAVMVIPVLDDETLLLISEYSAGTHRYELGFPKGLIDPGETALEAGNRELKEEIGYGANKLVELKKLTLAPGYFNAQMTILLAFDLYPERLEGDEPEPLEIVPWSLNEAEKLLDHPDFSESRSVAALFLAQQFLAQQ